VAGRAAVEEENEGAEKEREMLNEDSRRQH
jgi:hypothetical protein